MESTENRSPNIFAAEEVPQFDVLVVGAGAAGLYAALCLPQHLQVAIIAKEHLPLSASDWAQGGIAAAIAPDDSPQIHLEDTLKAGAGLCDRAAVDFLVQKAPECVQHLADLGVGFDRQNQGFALTLEAAHSRRRVLHASDTTGRAVTSTLAQRVRERENIQIIAPALAHRLWLHPQQHCCQGISIFYENQLLWLSAPVVVLATGGGGQVFARTTNPSVSTGDGVAIAWHAGAMLRDLEFVQFHPTALTKPGAPHFLISEAVRGEGAHLVDNQGHRFAFDYHPDGELAPRDVVSRAIFWHFQRLGLDPATANVWLDMRPIPPERIRHRFPNIIQVCRQWGIDVFNDPIPVAPAAHYWMGGIATDRGARTSMPGLYAVGETTSTGIHGANRLASNSLLECIVYGAELARVDVPPPGAMPPMAIVATEAKVSQLEIPSSQWETIAKLRQEIPRLVWQSAGLVRDRERLTAGMEQIKTWQQEFTKLEPTQFFQNLIPGQNIHFARSDTMPKLRAWGETQNLLDVAMLVLQSACFREESRGAHYREDFPHPRATWQKHISIQNQCLWTSDSEISFSCRRHPTV
ncbi:L-aspartate oxidase [Geitlerinema sp. PCC 9228]|uniref:L-aspartate oxidase n=1 Tax=Geitlerinema sp. PCC 9228 TaxID=111611 RepID=UPI0008F9C85B|nr:L-aspartate oxidase [Geitlerinema sp. PCC 9228]